MSNNPAKVIALQYLKNDNTINGWKAESTERAVSMTLDLIRKVYEDPTSPLESVAYLLSNLLGNISKLNLANLSKFSGKKFVVATIENVIDLVNESMTIKDKEAVVAELESLVNELEVGL